MIYKDSSTVVRGKILEKPSIGNNTVKFIVGQDKTRSLTLLLSASDMTKKLFESLKDDYNKGSSYWEFRCSLAVENTAHVKDGLAYEFCNITLFINGAEIVDEEEKTPKTEGWVV